MSKFLKRLVEKKTREKKPNQVFFNKMAPKYNPQDCKIVAKNVPEGKTWVEVKGFFNSQVNIIIFCIFKIIINYLQY